MADSTTANSGTTGLPAWGSADLTNFLARAPVTRVSRETRKWYIIEDEIERLRERLTTLSQSNSDKVMISMVRTKISDQQRASAKMAEHIADLPAINTFDLACKLIITTRLACGTDLKTTPGYYLNCSALKDLFRVLQRKTVPA